MYYQIHLDLRYGILPSFNYNIIQTIAKDKILLQRDSNSITDSSPSPKRCFVLVDSDAAIHRWITENVPVIAWSHEKNSSESLMGTRYMILSPDALSREYLEEIHCRFHGIPFRILETQRSYLRELTMEDLENVLALDAEQEWNSHGRFFRFANALSSEEDLKKSKEYLHDYINTQYPFYGYGIYAAFHKKTDLFLGIIGFGDTEEGEIEFGYAVKKHYQQQGYAKEWGQALIPYAKEQWEFEKIVARIPPENLPSIKTAQSCGVMIQFLS